jgi:hypothetical protein
MNFVPVDNIKSWNRLNSPGSAISPPRGRPHDQVSGIVTRVHSCAVAFFLTRFPVWPACTSRVVRGVPTRAKPEVLATKTDLT